MPANSTSTTSQRHDYWFSSVQSGHRLWLPTSITGGLDRGRNCMVGRCRQDLGFLIIVSVPIELGFCYVCTTRSKNSDSLGFCREAIWMKMAVAFHATSPSTCFQFHPKTKVTGWMVALFGTSGWSPNQDFNKIAHQESVMNMHSAKTPSVVLSFVFCGQSIELSKQKHSNFLSSPIAVIGCISLDCCCFRVTHIPHKLTARLQKCNAEVLPLPSTDWTIQMSQQPQHKSHADGQFPTHQSPDWLFCVSILTLADPALNGSIYV